MIAAAICWLCWAGSYPGWGSPLLRSLNAMAGSAAILAVALLWERLRARPALTWPILGGLAALALTTATSVQPVASLYRLGPLAAYAAGYWLAARYVHRRTAARGIVLAGWFLLALAAFEAGYMWLGGGPARSQLFGNANAWGLVLVGLAPVGVATLRGWRRWLWAGLCVVAVAATASRTAGLGLAVGLILALGGSWRVVAATLIVTIPLVAVRPATVGHRLNLWRGAVEVWLQSPIVGTGPGTAALWAWWIDGGQRGIWHAHNIIMNSLAETGLVGLAALAWLAWELWRRRPQAETAPRWPWAVLVALAVASMADAAFLFGGPALLALLAAASLCGVRCAVRVDGTVGPPMRGGDVGRTK